MKITLQKINKDLFEVDVSDDGTVPFFSFPSFPFFFPF